MEDIRRCKKRGRRGLPWTSARQALAKMVALGGGGGRDAMDCAGVGSGAIRAGGFLPVEAAGDYKTVAGAYFRCLGACTQYDPKVIVGAKTLNLKAMHIMAPRGHNT